MDAHDDPHVLKVALIGLVGAIMTFVVVVGLQALFYHLQEEEWVGKVYSQAPEALSRLRAEQLDELHKYRWIDPQKGVAAVPIERAMELTVLELSREGGRED